MSTATWRREILKRFSDRECVGDVELFDRYWVATGCPREAVMEVLSLIHQEYEVPIGLLRPADDINKLLDPVPTRNPFKWLFHRAATEDSASELNYQLALRLERHGVPARAGRIHTLGDYVRAWCGKIGADPVDAGETRGSREV
jgi:hypothetical protein